MSCASPCFDWVSIDRGTLNGWRTRTWASEKMSSNLQFF
jgi:hypothetical protein